jgi:hypothetical protein
MTRVRFPAGELLSVCHVKCGKKRKATPGGTRTHNLWLRKPTPYPLGYGGSIIPPAGLEPATFGLEVQRAIHCAKGASSSRKTQSAGFEPAWAEPNGFQVHPRNHLGTIALTWVRSSVVELSAAVRRVPGSNPGVPFFPPLLPLPA